MPIDKSNLVGLKRKGVNRSDITSLRAAFQILAQGDGTFEDRAKKLKDETNNKYVEQITNFILSDSDRSFLVPGGL